LLGVSQIGLTATFPLAPATLGLVGGHLDSKNSIESACVGVGLEGSGFGSTEKLAVMCLKVRKAFKSFGMFGI
jgi:hypothetical protein